MAVSRGDDGHGNAGDVLNHEYLLISDDDFIGSPERSEIADRRIIPTYAELYTMPAS